MATQPVTPAPAAPPVAPTAAPAPVSAPNYQQGFQQAFSAALADPPAAPAAEQPVIPPAVPVAPETPVADAPVDPQQAAPLEEDTEFEFPDETQQAATAEATPNPDAEFAQAEANSFEGMLPKEVEDAFLRTNRGKRMLQGFKAMREMEAPPDQGGLGRMPTADEMKSHFVAANDLAAMRHEFNLGEPQAAESFIRNWFGPDDAGQVNPATQVVADRLPHLLLAENPQAYSVLAKGVLHLFSNAVLNEAANQQSPEARAHFANLARSVQAYVTGKFTPDDQIDQLLKPVDPLLAREQQLNARERQWETQQRRDQEQRWNGFVSATEGRIKTTIAGGVEHALAPLKGKVSQVLFNAARDQMTSEVMSAVRNDPFTSQQYRMKLDNSRRTQTDEDKNGLVNLVKQAATPVVRRLLAQYTKDLADQAVNGSNARHEQLATAASKVAPVGSAQPAQQSVVPGTNPQRRPGESDYDFRKRGFAEMFASTLR